MAPTSGRRVCVFCGCLQPKSLMVSVTKRESDREVWVRKLGPEFLEKADQTVDPRLCLSHFPPSKAKSPRSKIAPYKDGKPHHRQPDEEDKNETEDDSASEFEDDIYTDPTYETDDYEDFSMSEKFMNILCSWSLILPHISKCWECLRNNIQANGKPTVIQRGVAIEAKFECMHCGNCWRWESSKQLKQEETRGSRQFEINVTMAASIMTTGNGFMKISSLSNVLQMPFFSKRRYNQLVNSTVMPAVEKYYDFQREKNMEKIKEQVSKDGGLNLSGDGQFDSRGFSAYICRFALMDISTKYVLDFEVVRKERGGNSMIMEKVGHEKSMPRLLDELKTLTGIANPIRSLTTDRCVNLAQTMKNYPSISHFFDSWHFIRSIAKDIREKKKQKQFQPVKAWERPLLNHIHSAISQAKGDGALAYEIILSFFFHIQNIHDGFKVMEGFKFKKVKRCFHDATKSSNSLSNTIDLNRKDHKKAFKVLHNILTKPNRKKDIESVSPYFATSSLESFHSLATHYLPKECFYDKTGYVLRSKMAVIHWNELQSAEADGSRRIESKVTYYCKTKKTIVQKNRKTAAKNEWRHAVLNLAKQEFSNFQEEIGNMEEYEIEARAEAEQNMYRVHL